MMHNKLLTYWQAKVLYLMVVSYACYHLVRQNYSIVFSDKNLKFATDYQFVGWIFTINAVMYGFGKLINGYLSDRSSSKIFLSTGLFISGLLSLVASFFDNIFILGGIYIINGWVQSMGFPAIAKLVVNWIPKEKIASRWSIISCAQQIGGVIIMLAGGYLLEKYGWQYVLFIPGIITVVMSIILLNTIRDSPTEIGFNTIVNIMEEKPLSLRCLLESLLNKRGLQLLCLANMFSYVVRMGLLNWAPIFLVQYQGCSSLLMGTQISGYEAMGFIGTFCTGYIIDKFFNFNVSIVGAIYMLFFITFSWLLWYIPQESTWINILLMGLIGFIVYVPQVLVGILSVKISRKCDIGMINGVIGLFGYIGTAISGIGIGLIISLYGWNGSFIFFLLAAFIGVIIFLGLSYFEGNNLCDL